LEEYVRGLAERAEQVRGGRVTPEEDNMLLISSDGRKAALDLRLATGERGDAVTKLEVAAERIARIYQQYGDSAYLDPDTGEPSSVHGALQIVFCDLGTPKADQWNAYDELREQLHARGLPGGGVRYVHEARNDREKQQLFHAARAGHIAVLIGSTEKMGVGTNIQARAVALHHLDCPWRPADIEQRDGRIRRQGNQNAEVHILRYVVERSFDGYSWQTVERKAKFIGQVTRGRLDVRAIEDLGDSALSFAEVKALASGDPLILDLARAQNDVTRLQRLHRSWNRGKTSLTDTIRTSTALASARGEQIAAVTQAIDRRTDTHGARFRMTIDGSQVSTRTEAGELLVRWAQMAPVNELRPVGQLGAIDIDGTVIVDRHDASRAVRFELRDLPAEKAQRTIRELVDQPIGMVRQLEHRVATLHDLNARLERERDAALEEATRARETLGRPFKHSDALRDATEEVERIKGKMRASDQPETPAPHDMSRDAAATSTRDTSQAERITATLGHDRAGRLLRARSALKERFAHAAGPEAPLRWQDPHAHDCYREITAIVDAARRDPADHDAFRDLEHPALCQRADETLRAARALYTRASRPGPGSAHRAAKRHQAQQPPGSTPNHTHRPEADR
jgi:hypothetical protein